MKTRVIVALVAVALSSGICEAQVTDLTMSGVVTDLESHKSLEGAAVNVVGNKANLVLTDGDGSFILNFRKGVREGDPVRIRIEKSSYKIYDRLVSVSSTIPLQVRMERLTVNPSKVPASAATIAKDRTPKYQAIALSTEIFTWLSTEPQKIPNSADYTAELYRQYFAKFDNRVVEVKEKLVKCGANTDKLGEGLGQMHDPAWQSLTYLDSIAFGLREAANDIPGGHPECGTKPLSTGGFHEKDTGRYTLKVGGSALGLYEDQLQKPSSPMQIHGADLFKVYVEDGHFYVDTVLYGGYQIPTVRVEKNEVAMDSPYLDRNFTDKALEVVDQNGVPLLQMVFETERQISINGVFLTPDGKSAIIITPTTHNEKVDIGPGGSTKIHVPLKPLFKYPSWKYQGVYAND